MFFYSEPDEGGGEILGGGGNDWQLQFSENFENTGAYQYPAGSFLTDTQVGGFYVAGAGNNMHIRRLAHDKYYYDYSQYNYTGFIPTEGESSKLYLGMAANTLRLEQPSLYMTDNTRAFSMRMLMRLSAGQWETVGFTVKHNGSAAWTNLNPPGYKIKAYGIGTWQSPFTGDTSRRWKNIRIDVTPVNDANGNLIKDVVEMWQVDAEGFTDWGAAMVTQEYLPADSGFTAWNSTNKYMAIYTTSYSDVEIDNFQVYTKNA